MDILYKAIFLSHGGGPLPLLGDADHQQMLACLQHVAGIVPRPEALVVVSAHWEADLPTITSGVAPPLLYDYYGFPDAAYEIGYPCPGSPDLAREIHGLLGDAGIPSELDDERGFDHGLFVPLKIMYPDADIPCVQLSLVDTLDPFRHIEIGRALQSLSCENVLVIGSGFSFHNMKAFFQADIPHAQASNESFEAWLRDTCCRSDYTEEERAHRLVHWTDAPGARFCHPREEHLLPLHVCYGVAQARCADRFGLTILNKKSSIYLW